MTSSEAIYEFISGIFGTAVPSGSVYSGRSKPLFSYAAYSAPLSPVFGAKAEGYIDYYYIDDINFTAATERALTEFSRQVGLEGKTIDFDGGRLYITRGEPFYKLSAEKSDQSRKCVRFKLNLCYIDPSVSLTLTDGNASYVIDSRSEISVSSKLVGARAESVTGKSCMDVLGTKTAVSIKTCWLEKQVGAGITRLIASSPVQTMRITDPFGSPDGAARTSDFIFDMPRIIALAYEPESGKEYVRLEINAGEQGVQSESGVSELNVQSEVSIAEESVQPEG